MTEMQLKHLSIRVSEKAHARILAACEQREEIEAAKVPAGRILNELVIKYLAPTDDELTSPPQPKTPRPIAPGSKSRVSGKPSAAA